MKYNLKETNMRNSFPHTNLCFVFESNTVSSVLVKISQLITYVTWLKRNSPFSQPLRQSLVRSKCTKVNNTPFSHLCCLVRFSKWSVNLVWNIEKYRSCIFETNKFSRNNMKDNQIWPYLYNSVISFEKYIDIE